MVLDESLVTYLPDDLSFEIGIHRRHADGTAWYALGSSGHTSTR